jgi:beta-glucanase (GH16 family)
MGRENNSKLKAEIGWILVWSEEFDESEIDLSPLEMRWYIDDKIYYKSSEWYTREGETSEMRPYPAPFSKPFYLMLNLAVGGNWPGYPNEETVFPQTLEVDYIRIYQPEDGNYDLEEKQ